ncbi:MAG: serine/threonine-protein kinase [Actinomycetota bacterium]
MFYCPKCRRTYEEGTQRFCENDGGRLWPAPSAQKADTQSNGVFTNLLSKTPQSGETDKKINPAPRFAPLNKTEESDKKLTSFPSAGRIFQSDQVLPPKIERLLEIDEDSILELDPLPPKIEEESLLELEPPTPIAEPKIEPTKPLPRNIKLSEIPSGTASIGDRKTNPPGREALSWENTGALLGQTVKGRYRIVEELEADDEDSLIYLAEDKIVTGKRAVVRVFMDDRFDGTDFSDMIFAEERVSLAHLNHPNIAGVFDSGKLPEGNEFIVSEFVEGKSLKEILRQTGQFNALRTARIIRQTSYALGEAHQNGILHRNLKPENIFLTISEAGIEQVKLMNFGVSHGDIEDGNLAYKAPEEIGGGISTFASDIYALAVIAYQMLTARLPFNTETESRLLKAQKEGLTLLPTDLRLDIQPLADKILEKALAFNPSDRYPKARDFGDALFNALTAVSPWSDENEAKSEGEISAAEEVAKQREFIVIPSINQKDLTVKESAINPDIHISPRLNENEDTEIAEVKSAESLPWENRSTELPKTRSSTGRWLALLGIILLLPTLWGLSRLFLDRANEPEITQNTVNSVPSPEVIKTVEPKDLSLTSGEPDIAPEPRLQKQLPNTERFQNNRDNLKGDLAKNFLGFNIYYPQDWIKTETLTNFLDISKKGSNGLPIEQMLITRYESRGTLTLDRPTFPKLVEKSNADLKKFLGDSYKVVSEDETAIQEGNRWKAHEIKFQGETLDGKGEKVTIWGRRLWIPVQRAGVQNGFVITMLATSLSDTVKSADDVGNLGELAKILETFEPDPTF